MISNFQNQPRKQDFKMLSWVIIIFLLLAWFCTPPGNKFLQICFWGNNTKYFIEKIIHKDKVSEYLFHRNNAIYLAKMYPDKKSALMEMNKAIETLPKYASEDELKNLYKERAEIRLFLGDHKGALNDFINSGMISFNDNLKVAMLFKIAGKYRDAMGYCNAIVQQDPFSYTGFACMADIYVSINRPDVAIKVWDLAIDRNKTNQRAYIDRALVKKSIGDLSGYNADMEKAKTFSPIIDLEESIVKDAIYPKKLPLSIR